MQPEPLEHDAGPSSRKIIASCLLGNVAKVDEGPQFLTKTYQIRRIFAKFPDTILL